MARYEFGGFVVDTDIVEVRGPDGVRDVEPQVFDVLRYLVEQGDRLVTKEELLDNVWGDRFVSESALTTRIKQARRAVDDDGTTQWAIKTVHGRGYRFLPEVRVAGATLSVDTPAPAGPPSGTPSGTPADALPTPPVGDLPSEVRADARRACFGREQELARCAALLDRAGRGFGWIWLLGEPGIGKTRLAAEVARVAHERGHRVLFGRNSEDLRVPYQPIIEALAQLEGDAVPAELSRLVRGEAGDVPDDLSGDVREHHDESELSNEERADDETRRFRLFEALAERLVAHASQTPLTILIDDVHWAAESTLQLLAHLQGRPVGGDVTFVLTSRDTAPDLSVRVADLIASAQGNDGTEVIRLAGLDAIAACRIVGVTSPADLDSIMRQTAGNPLFLQAVDAGDGAVDIESAVRRRLNALAPMVQDTLRLMSVVGLEFEVRVAAVANRRDELDLIDDLEAAVAAGLLDEVGVDRFRFTHALVRATLRDELSSARRARMHVRIAEAITDVFGDDVRHISELAHHTAEGAVVDAALRPLAVTRLRTAAEVAVEQLSFEEAADLLRRARALADPDDGRLLACLALEQGMAEFRAARNIPAVQTLSTAVELARKAADPTLFVESALRYEDATWRPGLPGDHALEVVDEAIRLIDGGDVSADEMSSAELPATRLRLAVARFRALAMSGRRHEVDAGFDAARRLAAELGSPNEEANVLSVYLGHVVFHERPADAAPMIDRLAELEPLIDDHDVALHALHDRILHATLTGDPRRRRRLATSMSTLQATSQSHSRFWTFIRANQEAMEAFYQGDLGLAERLAGECLDLADQIPGEDGSGTYGLRMFMIRREQDRLSTMLPVIRHVVASARDDALWTPGLAMALAETGALEEAAEALAPARAAGFDVPIDAMWSTSMVFMIETMVRVGDHDACAMLRDRFAPLAGINVTTGSGLMCFGRADRYLGMLSYVLGDLECAEHHLGTALEGDVGGGSVLWGNESRWWLSRVRRAQGHETEADAMAEVVAAEAAAAGLARLARLGAAEPVR